MTDTTVTFDRPVAAKLLVRLETGEEWEASPEDLARFGYGKRLDLYVRAASLLAEGLGLEHFDELAHHEGPNLVRYVLECAIMYNHSPWADSDGQPWPEDEDREDYQAQLRAVILEEVPS